MLLVLYYIIISYGNVLIHKYNVSNVDIIDLVLT